MNNTLEEIVFVLFFNKYIVVCRYIASMLTFHIYKEKLRAYYSFQISPLLEDF